MAALRSNAALSGERCAKWGAERAVEPHSAFCPALVSTPASAVLIPNFPVDTSPRLATRKRPWNRTPLLARTDHPLPTTDRVIGSGSSGNCRSDLPGEAGAKPVTVQWQGSERTLIENHFELPGEVVWTGPSEVVREVQ